ncbi:MAG: hypothetical protein WD066_02705 [Planctomycetaceae bacterium]
MKSFRHRAHRPAHAGRSPGRAAALAVAFVAMWAAAAFAADDLPAPEAKAAKLPFTVSKETTYITEPLREDGSPDFAAAIENEAKKGVTPENNAAVLYWRALGPGHVDPSQHAEFFAKLGMDVPLEDGDYLIGFRAFAQANSDEPVQAFPFGQRPAILRRLDEELTKATSGPWTERELPLMAEWLKRNEKPLALVVEGSQRPKYFSPVHFAPRAEGAPPSVLIVALLPHVQGARDFVRLLTARAMLRLGEGKRAEAEADLLAAHRLGRQVAQGWSLIEQLVGIAIESIAGEGDLALARHGGLTAAQAADYLARLDRLPPRRPMIEAVDYGERLTYLSAVCHVAIHGAEGLSGEMMPDRGAGARFKQTLMTALVDWDVPLTKGNELYDELVAAGRAATREERQRKLAAFDQDFRRKMAELGDPKTAVWRALTSRSETVSDFLTSLMIPAVGAALVAEDRAIMQLDLTRLAFALAAHHADHRECPAALDALAPKYVNAVPKDLFSGDALVYRRTEDRQGYVLYSVGPNGEDDAGRDHTDDPRGDDLVIRMPRTEEAK